MCTGYAALRKAWPPFCIRSTETMAPRHRTTPPPIACSAPIINVRLVAPARKFILSSAQTSQAHPAHLLLPAFARMHHGLVCHIRPALISPDYPRTSWNPLSQAPLDPTRENITVAPCLFLFYLKFLSLVKNLG